MSCHFCQALADYENCSEWPVWYAVLMHLWLRTASESLKLVGAFLSLVTLPRADNSKHRPSNRPRRNINRMINSSRIKSPLCFLFLYQSPKKMRRMFNTGVLPSRRWITVDDWLVPKKPQVGEHVDGALGSSPGRGLAWRVCWGHPGPASLGGEIMGKENTRIFLGGGGKSPFFGNHYSFWIWML